MVAVVTIDGPSGSGKGTVSQLLAQRLGWHFLDSGALYRLLGLAAQRQSIGLERVPALVDLAGRLQVAFEGDRVLLDGQDVSDEIRTETCGAAASKLAALPEVREALLDWQRGFAREPGLVADGRDMGSVVFPEAVVKVFLTASAEERALRRYKQLKEKGLDVNLVDLTLEIEARDERDRTRSVAPLRAPAAALVLDSTGLSIDQVLETVWRRVCEGCPELVD